MLDKAVPMRVRGEGIAAFSILIALLLPLASAGEQANGLLDVSGPVLLEGMTTAQPDQVLAFVVPDLSNGITVHLKAPGLSDICNVTKEFAGIQTSVRSADTEVPTSGPDCHEETDLAITAGGSATDPRDYFAAYPKTPDSMRVTLQSEGLREEAAAGSHQFNSRDADRSTPADPKANEWYLVRANDSVVVTGVASVEGIFSGCLKFHGPSVDTSSTSGSQHYTTTQTDSGGILHTTTVEWLYVCVQDAALTITGNSPILMGVNAMSATTQGSLHFTSTGGNLASDHFTYETKAKDADLTGTLTTNFSASSQLHVVGSLNSAMMARARIPTSPLASNWGKAGVLGAVLLGGGLMVGAVVLYRRRAAQVVLQAAPPAATVPSPARVAREFAAIGELGMAIEFARAARQEQPGDADLALQEGLWLFRLGQYAEALRAFDAAILLTTSGEPEYWAARTAIRLGQHDAAEVYAARGLDRARSEGIVSLFAQSRELAGLRGRASVRAALEALPAGLP